MLKCCLENDSYPKAVTTENKGKFVSKCHFCDLNPLCFQISILGTLGLFRSSSQKSVFEKASLCSTFMNYMPGNITFSESLSQVPIV
jgi:hypothetical protein